MKRSNDPKGVHDDPVKVKFVLAALDDLNEHGLTELSMRRVAARCGMSSGAAYRHFSDRNELGLEVFRYLNEEWREAALSAAAQGATTREKLENVAVAYVGFLSKNPCLQSFITVTDGSVTEAQRREKAKMSELSEQLTMQYAEEVGMDEQTRIRKTFAVRAFIYGGALFINSGELPDDGNTMKMVRDWISREFDLP